VVGEIGVPGRPVVTRANVQLAQSSLGPAETVVHNKGPVPLRAPGAVGRHAQVRVNVQQTQARARAAGFAVLRTEAAPQAVNGVAGVAAPAKAHARQPTQRLKANPAATVGPRHAHAPAMEVAAGVTGVGGPVAAAKAVVRQMQRALRIVAIVAPRTEHAARAVSGEAGVPVIRLPLACLAPRTQQAVEIAAQHLAIAVSVLAPGALGTAAAAKELAPPEPHHPHHAGTAAPKRANARPLAPGEAMEAVQTKAPAVQALLNHRAAVTALVELECENATAPVAGGIGDHVAGKPAVPLEPPILKVSIVPT